MFKQSKIGSAVLLALGGALLAPVAVQAQDTQRIEVTGSLIRRISSETASQIVTLRSEDLQKAGVTNAEQAVKFITQQQGGTVTSSSVSGTNGAAAYANLRSLGEGRTLVLLNGKRVAPNPFAVVGTDLNTLPLAAVDRIETLPDGASSIYGTDAIAGVINFITKKDYKGGSVGATAQVTEDGGGDVTTATLLGGIGDMATQRWNVYAGLNVRKQDPMRGDKRAFARSSYQPELGFNGTSPTTFPANYSQTVAGVTTVSNANPTSPNCDPPGSISIAETNGTRIRCFADTQIYTNTVPKQDQNSLFLRGSLALGADNVASLEYFRAENTVRARIAPSPEGGLSMPSTSPFYPGNGITAAGPASLNTTRPISINWRTVPLGSREGQQENVTQRLVANLEGTAGGFDYQVSALTSRAKVDNFFLNGYPTTLGLRAGVNGCAAGYTAATGACTTPLLVNGSPLWLNPFGAQTAEGQAYLESIEILGQVQDGESKSNAVQATVSRAVGRLAGGDVVVAANASFQKDEMVYNTDIAKVSQAASSGLAGAGAQREGDRDIKAVSLELNLPVLKGLEFGVSVRHDKYSDFGSTTNPKVSFRWQPIDAFVFRGSANTGFAAPSLYNLYLPNSTTFTANRYNDPVLCPGGVPGAGAIPARDCGLQFQQLQGGNAGLTAEESKAWSLGIIVEPTRNLTLGLDYWSYKITDSISTIGEQTIFSDPAKYAGLYVRCSQATAAQQAALGACQNPGAVDPLAYVINTFLNLGDVKTSGIDLSATLNSGPTSLGRFSAVYRGTYVTKYEFQVEPGGTFFNPVGRYVAQFAGPVIRYQQVINVKWDVGPWSTLITNKYLNGYIDQNSQGAPFNVAPFNTNRVREYSVFDLSVSYSGFKNTTLQAGILNVFDQDPPFTNQVGRFQARGYDDRFANPLGRTYQVSARYDF
jgi:iron complex outermembrane receptor protein